MPSAATPALATLREMGIVHRVLEYEPPATLHGRHAWGEEAAAALGVDPACVGKTLVAEVDGSFVLVIVPVDAEVDAKALARVRGAHRASLAEPAVAERVTGAVRGGISPLGSRRPLPVVIDAGLLDRAEVLVSAGRRGLSVALAPADLVRATRGQVARVARRR